MRFGLPYMLRSPSYRRTIARRLAPPAPASYHRADYTAGPCYLPPDLPARPQASGLRRTIIALVVGLGAWAVLGFAIASLGGF